MRTWRQGGGLYHDAIDDGELPAERHKQTPMMVPDGEVPWARLRREFRERAQAIDAAVVEAVSDVLGA